QCGGARIVCSDNNPIRMFEVINRRALAQEFRIRHNGEVSARTHGADNLFNFVACPNGNSRFVDDDCEALDCGSDLLGGGINKTQIRLSVVASPWRPNRDEDHLSLMNRGKYIR